MLCINLPGGSVNSNRKKLELLWISWPRNLVWWHIPLIPSFGRQRQKFKARENHTVRLFQNPKTDETGKEYKISQCLEYDEPGVRVL